jgi:nitroreductase
MVRDFSERTVPPEVLERILEAALHGPSAGFAQGLELVVLDAPDDVVRFAETTDPWRRKRPRGRPFAPVVVIPLADKRAYLARYSEPDKRGLGMEDERGWPVAYWELDAAMAVMLLLLAAVDEGLGAWYFGIFRGERELLEWLGAPDGPRPIGAVALGYPARGERARGSSRARRRRALGEVVHRGRWGRH